MFKNGDTFGDYKVFSRLGHGVVCSVLVLAGAAGDCYGFADKPSQEEPKTVAKALSSDKTPAAAAQTPVPAVIGCDVSPHGWPGFYCGLVSAGDASPFGKGARFLPLQFKLTGEVLDKVNLLVLATPKINGASDFDDRERKAVREFAERGGVVLALVRSTGKESGESRGSAQGLLKSYGATLFNASGKSKARAVLAKALEGGGSFTDPACDIFAKCSDEWSPLAVIQGDPTKVVSAVRPLGKGFLVFAHESYVCSQPDDTKLIPGFPWDKVVSSRLKPVRRPDPSFAGSTLDDAPYEARSSRLRFVSSVISTEHLRKVAKMDDLAVAYLTRRFGKDALGLHPAQNCIVGVSMAFTSPAWAKRFRDLDALDTIWMMVTPEGRVIENVWHYVFYHSLVPHWNRMRTTELALGMYMEAVACDELLRQGYLTDGRNGLESVVAQARKLDPDFTLYNFDFEPKSPTTPKIDNKDKGLYYWGRIYAMLDDLVKERPDLLARCREVVRDRNESKRGYDVFMADLCKAYGSDRPRRWPAPEEKVPSLHAAKAAAPISVDGALDEPVWQNAEWSRPFIPGNPAAKFTNTAATVAVAFDDKAAYFALRGPYPADAKPKPHKGDVLADMFAMLISPAEGVAYEIWLFPNGSISACRCRAAEKKDGLTWKMSKMVGALKAEPEKNFFSAELKIPFSEFNVAVKGRGEKWRANFIRNGAGSGGWSEWVGLSKRRMEYDATRFGRVVFGGK